MTTKTDLLDAALGVLDEGAPLTLDAVASRAGLTKPGVVHHFATKQALATAVVDHVMQRWEAELTARVEDDSTARDRLRAYVDFALTAEMDPSDLALLADVRLRDRLQTQWVSRLAPWLGDEMSATPAERAGLQAARLLADGAWFDRALGIVDLDEEQRAAILEIAHGLIPHGTAQ